MDKLEIAKTFGADETLISGDDGSNASRTSPRARAPNSSSTWSGQRDTGHGSQAARVLGHLAIVGLGNAALPVSFTSPANQCSVAPPFWGTIPELIEVIGARPERQDQDARRTLRARGRGARLPPVARRQDPGTRRHHAPTAHQRTLYVAIAFATASPSGVTTSTSQFTNVLPRRSTRPHRLGRWGAQAQETASTSTSSHRAASPVPPPAQAAPITVTSASAAIAPPCTMSPR